MGIAPVNYANGMPALPGSHKSLQHMRDNFRNAKNLVGNEASKGNFLRNYYKYKIIQLYTHATDSGLRSEPEIYFSDGALYMSDLLFEYRPATRLIVLSACETAEGKLYNGEGVFSFNRQFAALGIPSCISTLWKADNRSTYRITELFYKYLAKVEPLDVSLQSAKKEFISSNRENKLPYYWAAPILVGKSDSIQLEKPFPWKWATLAIATLALLGVGGWRMRRRRNQKTMQMRNPVLQT